MYIGDGSSSLLDFVDWLALCRAWLLGFVSSHFFWFLVAFYMSYILSNFLYYNP